MLIYILFVDNQMNTEYKEFWYYRPLGDDFEVFDNWGGTIEIGLFKPSEYIRYRKKGIYDRKEGYFSINKKDLFETKEECIKWLVKRIEEDIDSLQSVKNSWLKQIDIKDRIRLIIELKKNKEFVPEPKYDEEFFAFVKDLDKL